jgi:DNA replication protein DnaC
VKKQCQECGKEFEAVMITLIGREYCFEKYCPACKPIREQQERDMAAIRQEQARTEEFNRACPPLYRETDPRKLPCNPDITKLVLGWTYGAKGLVLHGATGRGKTRLAYLLVKRLVLEGRTVSAFDPLSFAHRVGETFGEYQGERFIREQQKVDVLMLDDLGKAKLTERAEAELFGLVEHRIAHFKPLIVTTNFVGDKLSDKLSEDRATPLVRRLREFNECVCVR